MRTKMFICAVVFAAVAWGAANSGSEKVHPAGAAAELPVQAGGGDDLAKLGKARRDAADKAYKAWLKSGAPGGILANENPISVMTYQLSIQWLNAELDLTTKKEERIAAYAAHLHRMQHWEKAWDFVAPGSFVFVMIRSFQSEAEYWLAKERSMKK